jgi:PKD repeat protein
MNMISIKRFGVKLALLAGMLGIWLPEEQADAQSSSPVFNYNEYGDVLAGFRKTGNYAGNHELVVDLGSVINFLNLSKGSTITITNLSPGQLTDAFTNYNNLQWSAFTTFPNTLPWSTSLGSFPPETLWFTLPGTNVNTQTQPPKRFSAATQGGPAEEMLGVGLGAAAISSLLASNSDNTPFLVREPTTYSSDILTEFIGDINNTAIGDFGANNTPLPFTVENVTTNPFVAAERSDFYQSCPATTSSRNIYTDPITGQTNGSDYFIGYFLLNPNGTMTFTRASGVSLPTVGFTSTVTNGFSPLSVVFTNTATGSITSWVWNFGNGDSITNATGANVTNTYTTGGDYTVTLTVYGPGGSSTLTVTNLIVASPTPKISETFVSSHFVLSGTNCPVGVQYRILNSTNVALPLANWQPVFTNTFLNNGSFAYTNSMTDTAGFFQLVSP